MEWFFYILLGITSVVGLMVLLERGWALQWEKVIPQRVQEAMAEARKPEDLPALRELCARHPSPLSRLVATAIDHLGWTKSENAAFLETRARHEVAGLERGLVVLEIVVGIAPLLGLVGTIFGLITLFGDLGEQGLDDHTAFARGIAIALRATLGGLMIAIPALIAWSYYSKKVETFAVEMETLCDEFLRTHYHEAAAMPASRASASSRSSKAAAS